MDKGIEKSIKTRRDAVYANYDLPHEARLKAEALFERIEQFGERCRDQADFEEKFLTLTLNRELFNLFVDFTAYVRNPEETPSLQEQITRNAAWGVRFMPEELHRGRTRGLFFNKLNIIQRFIKHSKKL